ncbi:MAG: ribose 5-phosphate isomerase B [Acidimicrobiia bacterium]|nr:ribose 5-phosphate isomerase B [Acidimicrobiia bacterium]
MDPPEEELLRIAVGADHAGFRLKEQLVHLLKEWGHEVVDLGTHSEESVDYPDSARVVAEAVARGDAERGVLVCGTGIGQSIAANKVDGVRAAVVHDATTARLSRAHNDANVMAVGARIVGPEVATEALSVWLATPFDGGRHERRVKKIAAMERDEG